MPGFQSCRAQAEFPGRLSTRWPVSLLPLPSISPSSAPSSSFASGSIGSLEEQLNGLPEFSGESGF